MKAILVLILVGLFGSSFLLWWAIDVLPDQELRRRLRSDTSDHKTAKYIHAFNGLGMAARFFVWVIGTAAAAILLFWAAKGSYWLASALVVLFSFLIVKVRRPFYSSALLFNAAGTVAHLYVWLLGFAEPVLSKLPITNQKHKSASKLFEVEDLLDLLNAQPTQPGNRIDYGDIQTARAALKFKSKKVNSKMTAIDDIRIVQSDEAIDPHLLDELHASGHTSFLVGKKLGRKVPPEIEGTVYLSNLVDVSTKKTAGQVASRSVGYVAQDQNLTQVLETFLVSHSPILVVQNEREESVGVIWLEDVLSELLGHKLKPEEDNFADADKREVADANDQKMVK